MASHNTRLSAAEPSHPLRHKRNSYSYRIPPRHSQICYPCDFYILVYGWFGLSHLHKCHQVHQDIPNNLHHVINMNNIVIYRIQIQCTTLLYIYLKIIPSFVVIVGDNRLWSNQQYMVQLKDCDKYLLNMFAYGVC